MKHTALVVLAFFILGASPPVAPRILSEYGSFPNPRIIFDDANYPNQAFSDQERLRRNGDYGRAYIRAYILDYSKSRGIPPTLLPAAASIEIIPELTKREGSFGDNLKSHMDELALAFEQVGGVEMYNYLVKQADQLEQEVAQLKSSVPEVSTAQMIPRLAAAREMLSKTTTAGESDRMRKEIADLKVNIQNTKVFLRFGWLFVLFFLIAGFRAWRFVPSRVNERKMI